MSCQRPRLVTPKSVNGIRSHLTKTKDSGHRLLLVGGGHCHIQLIHWFITAKKSSGVKLDVGVISDASVSHYSGMVPGYLMGRFNRDELNFELKDICEQGKIAFYPHKALDLKRSEKKLFLSNSQELHYSAISFNIGIGYWSDSGPTVCPVKPLASFFGRWDSFVSQLRDISKVAIVGGGASGIELSVAIREQIGQGNCTVHLFQSKSVFEGLTRRQTKSIASDLKKQSIQLHFNSYFDFSSRQYDWIFSTVRPNGAGLFSKAGLDCDESGFLLVDKTLQSLSDEHVWGAGDCVHFDPIHFKYGIEKSGVMAVRQARTLWHNLHAFFSGKHLKEFRPQKTALRLIHVTPKKVIAIKGAFFFKSRILVKLKDWIDQRFVKKWGRARRS